MIKNPYNIIVIGIDTLRADHLGCYGYERQTSPAIDDFAKENVLFKNCFAQAPNTTPSFMSIMTSRYPTYHGILSVVRGDNGGRAYVLNKNIPTLTEILKQSGYRTAAFTDGAQLEPIFGFGRGFDYYSTNRGAGASRGLGTIPEKEIFYFLEQNINNSFYLFIHTFAVHSPWKAPWKYINLFGKDYNGTLKLTESFPPRVRWLQDSQQHGEYPVFMKRLKESENIDEDLTYYKSIYDGAIKYADDFFASLLNRLSQYGLINKTIIIFTSDHGQEMLAHGKLGHYQFYNEVLHVPLIMHIPNLNKAEVNQIVRSIDIMPTILDVLKIKIGSPVHGVSLAQSADKDLNLLAIAETERNGFAAQNKKYKLINHVQKIFLDELYDLENDPKELKNIAIDNLDIVEEMRWEFEEELHKYPHLRPKKKTIYLAPHLINQGMSDY